MKSKNLLKWSALLGLPIAAIAVFVLFIRNRAFADAVADNFSRPVRDFLGTLNSRVPFSVMEVLYAAAVISLIIFIVRTVVKAVHNKFALKFLGRRALILLTAVAWAFCAYLWLWSADYYTASFSELSGISSEGVATGDLYAVTAMFVRNAAARADTVTRDADGNFAEDPDEYLPLSAGVYDSVQAEFPFLAGECRVPKKMVFSKIMSLMGFTGVYSAYTGESNLNMDAPGVSIPLTAAHELAHQLGVTSEQECNFLGVAACLSSGDPVYEYSGWYSGSVYLMNALYEADINLWRELRAEVTGSYLIDWTTESEYWAKYDTPVSDVSGSVYDVYLKAHGDPLGIRSYGACVDLLVEYYKP